MSVEKLNYSLPTRQYGKTSKDNVWARFVDINKVVDGVNAELDLVDAAILAVEALVTAGVVTDGVTITGSGTAGDPLVAAGGSEYTETIVNISSAQILAMGTTPIELLPAPGAGMYYDVDRVVLENIAVTTGYTVGTSYLSISNSTQNIAYTASSLIGDAVDRVSVTKCADYWNDSVEGINYGQFILLNGNITLSTYDATDPTLGDGTLRVKIYHKTITFGA